MSSTSPSASVTRSFRALLRTVRETFSGDAVALSKSRAAVRDQFRANARERDAAKIARLVADAHDAASFLRESIVQAKLSKDGARYGARGWARRTRGAHARLCVQTASLTVHLLNNPILSLSSNRNETRASEDGQSHNCEYSKRRRSWRWKR